MIQELQTERLDINNKYEVFTTCKQGDNLKLKIIVYDKSLPADLSNYTCRLRAFKRDQMPLIQNTGITITNNIVYIEGDEQLTTTAGIVKAELQFVHKTTLQKKSSFYIIFNVISSVFNVDGAVSTPTCTLLKQLENDLDRVENIGYVLEDAKDTRDDLIVKTDAANTSNENLVNSTSTADTTKNALDTLNTNANTTKLALDTANTTAVTNKNNLDVANVQAVKNYEALEQLGDATDLAKKVEAQGSQLNDIASGTINILSYNVKNDGTEDCREKIQKAIDENPLKTIYFPNGKYLISNPIEISGINSKTINLNMSENATIFSNDNIECLIKVGYDGTSYNRHSLPITLKISGGVLDCSNCLAGMKISSLRQLVYVDYVNFVNIQRYGLILERNDVRGSSDTKVSYCYFKGDLNDISKESTAIWSDSYDNEFNHLRIDGVKKCMYITGGGSICEEIHGTMMYLSPLTKDYYDETIGFDVDCGGFTVFNMCYADTFKIGFNQRSTGSISMNQCTTLYYAERDEFESFAVKLADLVSITITDSTFSLPSKGINHILFIEKTIGTGTYRNGFIHLFGNNYTVNNTIPKTDFAYSLQLNRENYYQPYIYYDPKGLMVKDKWYIFAIIEKDRASNYEFKLSLDTSQSAKIILEYNNNVSERCNILYQKNILNFAHDYEYAIMNEFVENGRTFAYLAIKSNDSDSYCNPILSLTGGGHIYGYKSNFIPYTIATNENILVSQKLSYNTP